MFVLDEADEMLSRGFKDQIYEIFQKLSTSIQVISVETCSSHSVDEGLVFLKDVEGTCAQFDS